MAIIKKILKNPELAVKYGLHRTFKIFGHKNYQKFIILCRSRVGSNMLISMLNSHPSVYCEGEIFGRLTGKRIEDILRRIFSKHPWYIQAVGFKIFYYHPNDDDSNQIWDELNKIDNLYVLHLKRKNSLRTIVSRKIAGKLNSWIADSSKKITLKEKQIQFTPKELEEAFIQNRGWEKIGDQMFQSKQTLTVYYEDIIKDTKNEYQKITNFLKLKDHIPNSPLKKQNSEKLSELITNYQSLKKSFVKTEWSQFFTD